MTCPPCTHDCNQGETCPAKSKQAITESQETMPDDIAAILALRDMLDAQPIPEFDRVIWPERTWVGLTPEEILDMFDAENVYGSKWLEFARAVENKLKEKNT
jgi:hypothetical protein